MDINRVMVTISKKDNVVEIKTYDRKIGRKGRFLIDGKALDKWLENPRKSFFDADLSNRLRIWQSQLEKTGEIVYGIEFLWLSENWDGELHGYKQRFVLDGCEFEGAICCEVPCRLLSIAETTMEGVLEVTPEVRRRVAHFPKAQRRAFCKAIAANRCRYRDDVTKLYMDGKYDFFFRCAGGMDGGLILHHTYGSHDGLYYGVHT